MSHFSIGDLAAKAAISIRTLHHYDAIGLLCPTRREDNGYRYYSELDAKRLKARVVIDLFRGSLEFSPLPSMTVANYCYSNSANYVHTCSA